MVATYFARNLARHYVMTHEIDQRAINFRVRVEKQKQILSMQNPPKSQFFAQARALPCSHLRSAGHTKCDCVPRAQIKLIGQKLNSVRQIIC